MKVCTPGAVPLKPVPLDEVRVAGLEPGVEFLGEAENHVRRRWGM
jgi:hypothetical protein